jgi:formylglycine-generating enzyme required for sulfatase activity
MKLLKHKLFLFFALILCFSSLCGFAQEVLKAPKYPDGVYIREGHEKKYQTLTKENIFIPVYLFDTNQSAISEVKFNYYKKYFSEAPLKLEECVYFKPIDKLIYPYRIRHLNPFSFIFNSDTLNYNDKEVKDYNLKPEYFSYRKMTRNDPDGVKTEYLSYLKLNKPIENYYQPFYFKKTEVTNKEYREFVFWVRDSIARRLLADDGSWQFYLHPSDKTIELLDEKEQIPWDSTYVREVLETMYLPVEERFYKRREIDPRVLNYLYTNDKNEVCFVNVYPDTLAWVNNFGYADLEPMTNMYFWHPAFNNYPVTGITQLQAKAFMNWKTDKKQKELDKENSNYIIKYELPNEMEWEMVATADQEKGKPTIYSENFTRLYDESYITDLIVITDTTGSKTKHIKKGSDCQTSVYEKESSEPCEYDAIVSFPELSPDALKKKPLTTSRLELDKFVPPYLYNSAFEKRVKYNRKGIKYPESIIKISKDENEICFMGGNVSEWMLDTYKDNWLPVFTYHQNKLKKINTKDVQLLLATENYYNSKNDVDGVLVRGGNWYDYNEAISCGKNFEGINKKIFVSPDKAFATVGFRYVVKIYRKDEMRCIIKDLPRIAPLNKQEYKQAMPN